MYLSWRFRFDDMPKTVTHQNRCNLTYPDHILHRGARRACGYNCSHSRHSGHLNPVRVEMLNVVNKTLSICNARRTYDFGCPTIKPSYCGLLRAVSSRCVLHRVPSPKSTAVLKESYAHRAHLGLRRAHHLAPHGSFRCEHWLAELRMELSLWDM